jgi:hypothetical protein
VKNIFKYLAIVSIALGVGCTKDVDIPLPEYIPTLVIHSYISPMDSGVTVYVNMSRSAYNTSYNDLNNVTNATVKISDGTTTKTLTFYPSPAKDEYAYYYIDSSVFRIEAGKTYTLHVTTPDGKSASASTLVPGIVPINSLDYRIELGPFSDSIYKMNFTFTDPIGQDDYYKFGTYILVVDTVMNELRYSSTNEDYANYFSSDGKVITESRDAYGAGGFFMPEEVRMIDFRLMHVSREYYLYHQSIQFGGGGPFAEPMVPFTNVTGGVGVFGSYNYENRILR